MNKMETKSLSQWVAERAARPWWKRIPQDAVSTVKYRVDNSRYQAGQRWQKLTTGTSSSEWANIDMWLCRELAIRLRIMAAETPSYPADGWTHEEWVAHLNSLAEGLETYEKAWDPDEEYRSGRALPEKAKAALLWVAEHVEELWS